MIGKNFLVLAINGAGRRYQLLSFTGEKCTIAYITKSEEELIQNIAEDYLADLEENKIVFDETPCDSCPKKKSCPRRSMLELVDTEELAEIFRQARNIDSTSEAYALEEDEAY